MENAASASPLRVLFCGNSYTACNALPRLVQGLGESADPPRPMTFEQVTPGGRTLEQHWSETGAADAIRKGGWDIVVLQDHSRGPIDHPDSMARHARLLDAEIRKAGATTVFYLTWARQHLPDDQATLTRAYSQVAHELGAGVAPVGEAWAAAFAADPALVLHTDDRSHPNPSGSYLAACVFYATFFAASPGGLTHRIEGTSGEGEPILLVDLPDGRAAFLQRIAWHTVQTFRARQT